MQDFGLEDVAWALGSLLAVSIIGILWTQRAVIVSTLSGGWRSSLERARQQKAAREALYGYVDMSSQGEGDDRTTFAPLELDNQTPQPNQLELEELAVHEPAREPVNLRQLPKQDLIVLLAVQRDSEGKYIYSSNDITKFVGGTAADVKSLIAAVRSEKPSDQAARLMHLPRPASGWK